MPWIGPSAMRTNPYYRTYYVNWARLLVLGVIPFVLLVYYNYNIYKRLTLPSILCQVQPTLALRSNQESKARVLIVIVITFIFCHSIRIILNFYEMFVDLTPQMHSECATAGKSGVARWVLIASPFSELMLIVNSSVNMIIYCCLNTVFRRQISSCGKHFCKQFCCCSTVADGVDGRINIEMQQLTEQGPTDTQKAIS